MALNSAASGTEHHDLHPTPYDRLWAFLLEDKQDLIVLIVYTMVTGLLALAVPLAAQALVNTIAAGVFMQPLIVLTLLVLLGLVIAGILRLLQFCLVETLQQRIFARVALYLSHHVPRIQPRALVGTYAPELVNRFFDVITIQKTWSKIILDGPSAAMQIMVGLILMGIYSPILLAFDIFFLACIFFVIVVMGRGGLRSSIVESAQKYRVAQWLEELGRCHISFKMSGLPNYLMDRTDGLVLDWLAARKQHFSVLFRHAVGNYLLYAFASAGILGLGGWLVINRQLTLGQLVASELIVLSVLAALDKLIVLMPQVYDMLTGLDKIGHVTDMPVERQVGEPLQLPDAPYGLSVEYRHVRFEYDPYTPVLDDISLSIAPGSRVAIVGASGSGKSTLVSILCGLFEAKSGLILMNGIDNRELDLDFIRRHVGLVCDNNEIFEGTLEENIRMGRPYVRYEDLDWALGVAQMADDVARLPNGLKTRLVTEGLNLSKGQRRRLMIARAIVSRPRLLILDEAFTGIDENTKLRVLNQVYSAEHPWTMLTITHDPEVVICSNQVYVLKDRVIAETGTVKDLLAQRDSHFSSLFPDFMRKVLGGRPPRTSGERPSL